MRCCNKCKEEQIQSLLDFYRQEDTVKKISQSLSEGEKQILDLTVKSGYHPYYQDIQEIEDKYDIDLYQNSFDLKDYKLGPFIFI